MRFLLFLLAFVVTSASAVEVKFQKRAKDGTSVLSITGFVEHSQRLPRINFKRRTRIVISSPGGNPHGVRPLMDWFIGELRGHPGVPEVIVRGECSSSCLLILSTLNYLARTAEIKLILDRELDLGFHGCANTVDEKYSKECTTEMAKYQLIHGVSFEWMMENIELYARPNYQYVVYLKVTDPRLKKSRLINYGKIRSNTKALIDP